MTAPCVWCKYNPHDASAKYPEFVEETSDTVKVEQSTILLGNFNGHVGNDAGIWKGVIGRHGDADVNDDGRLLL